jgi:hypothetical protein
MSTEYEELDSDDVHNDIQFYLDTWRDPKLAIDKLRDPIFPPTVRAYEVEEWGEDDEGDDYPEAVCPVYYHLFRLSRFWTFGTTIGAVNREISHTVNSKYCMSPLAEYLADRRLLGLGAAYEILKKDSAEFRRIYEFHNQRQFICLDGILRAFSVLKKDIEAANLPDESVEGLREDLELKLKELIK